jgi:hypothetical protein
MTVHESITVDRIMEAVESAMCSLENPARVDMSANVVALLQSTARKN